MEQVRGQNQPQQPQPPLPCPRCNSNNTKFRYFNNHDVSQPRHYCKNCKRLWTVGGSLRNIPIGGTTRNRQTSAPCTREGSSSQPSQLEVPTLPQTFAAMGSQTSAASQEAIDPLNSLHFDSEFANLGAIDSLIQTGAINQELPEWDDLYPVPQQAFSQQHSGYNGHQSNVVNSGFAEFNPFNDRAGPSNNINNNDLVQPTRPLDSKQQEDKNESRFSKK